MQKTKKYFLLFGMIPGIISFLYFLSLVLHVPLLFTIVAILAVTFFAGRCISKMQLGIEDNSGNYWSIAILLAGSALFVWHTILNAPRYGEWDAWAIWNLDAKYLADPKYWTNLFLNESYCHNDYPKMLPGVDGFFMRICGGKADEIIPFITCMVITLLIPLFIFLETAQKNVAIAGLFFLLLVNDTFYLKSGLSQYADTSVALFFLGAFICIDYVPKEPKATALAAFFLGCCMWTKNEGMILSIIFTLFYARRLFKKGHIAYSLSGLALPLLVLFVFKHYYAPPNDMVSEQGTATLLQVKDPARYQMIWKYFWGNLNDKFYYLKPMLLLYVVVCIIKRKWPERQMMLVLACITALMLIYVVSPKGLEWHLVTSQDRLMLQVMPAMMFVLAKKFSGATVSLQQQPV